MATPPVDRRPRSLGWVGAAISVVALAGVVWWAVDQPAPRFPDEAGDWAVLGCALVVYGLVTALRGERWRLLLARQGTDCSRADCVSLWTVGFMGNLILPARAGDAMRTYLLSARTGSAIRPIIGTLVAERLLDVVALAVLLVVLAAALPDNSAAGVVLAAIAALLVIVAVAVRLSHRPGRHPVAQRIAGFVRPMLASTRDLLSRGGMGLGGFSLGIWLVEAVVWYLVAVSLGLDLSFPEAFYVLAFGGLSLMIPSGPGFAGTLDAALIVALRAFGVAGGQAVAYILLLRFVLFVPVSIAGAIALGTRYRGLRTSKASSAA